MYVYIFTTFTCDHQTSQKIPIPETDPVILELDCDRPCKACRELNQHHYDGLVELFEGYSAAENARIVIRREGNEEHWGELDRFFEGTGWVAVEVQVLRV